MRLTKYEDWAAKEARRGPARLTRDWATDWHQSHEPLIEQGAYEHAALIFAKMEFLGSLLEGHVLIKDGVKHAIAYADMFLPQRYTGLTAHGGAVNLFAMLRHKPLHGYTPAAVPTGPSDVVTWRFNDPHVAHLTVSKAGRLGIHGGQLHADFIASVRAFSGYLANNKLDAKYPDLPRVRWRRGFWLRFCPATSLSQAAARQQAWLQEGQRRRLY